jgi:steroid 5-alpha reductase family enzyme
MKTATAAILLAITLVIVPLFSYFFGSALGDIELKALTTLITITLIAIAYTFIVGEITMNNSQVDKLWSILPVVYSWVVADYGNYSPQLLMMSILVTIWGIRLTINFAKKGAYNWRFWSGVEDYRWKVLRQKPEFKPHWKWTLFNLFFISGYQNILILLLTLPSIVSLQKNSKQLEAFDYIVAGLMFIFIVFETIADIQQWNYQSKKWTLINKGEEQLTDEYKKGFLDKGLWAYSRHPNYFAEQAIWICFYLFSVAASGQWINWSIMGCLLLIILFQGSSSFSEEISASKYDHYKDYQKKVSRFIPFLK